MIRLNNSTIMTIIGANTQLFAFGSVFSADVLDTMFGIPLPDTSSPNPFDCFNAINKRNLRRLKAYTSLNKKLAERGISITQKTVNNETFYHVRTVDQLPRAVKHYRIRGKRATKRSRNLALAHQQIAIPGIE